MENFGQRMDAHTIRFERILPGPVEKIWAYLTDGQKRGEWFAAGALPSKVGETFELRFKHDDLYFSIFLVVLTTLVEVASCNIE